MLPSYANIISRGEMESVIENGRGLISIDEV